MESGLFFDDSMLRKRYDAIIESDFVKYIKDIRRKRPDRLDGYGS